VIYNTDQSLHMHYILSVDFTNTDRREELGWDFSPFLFYPKMVLAQHIYNLFPLTC